VQFVEPSETSDNVCLMDGRLVHRVGGQAYVWFEGVGHPGKQDVVCMTGPEAGGLAGYFDQHKMGRVDLDGWVKHGDPDLESLVRVLRTDPTDRLAASALADRLEELGLEGPEPLCARPKVVKVGPEDCADEVMCSSDYVKVAYHYETAPYEGSG